MTHASQFELKREILERKECKCGEKNSHSSSSSSSSSSTSSKNSNDISNSRIGHIWPFKSSVLKTNPQMNTHASIFELKREILERKECKGGENNTHTHTHTHKRLSAKRRFYLFTKFKYSRLFLFFTNKNVERINRIVYYTPEEKKSVCPPYYVKR